MAITISGTDGISPLKASGQTQTTTGTAASPAISSSSDTDSGIFFGTNEVNISTNGSTAATVDSSGNLGIGLTSPSSKAHIKGGSLTVEHGSPSTGTCQFNINSENNSQTTFSYDDAGSIVIGTAATPHNQGSFSEKLRLDSSGNVGIGKSTNLFYRLTFQEGNGDDNRIGWVSTSGNRKSSIDCANTDAIRFNIGTSDSEIARITSDGLLVGTATKLSDGKVCFRGTFASNRGLILESTESGGEMIRFNTSSGNAGKIDSSGTSTTYATSSDYRLKENIVDLDGAIDRVKQLAPKRFNFICDANTTVDGFIAHEAQTVVPEAITGTHNGVEVWREGEELPDGVSVGDNKLDEDGNAIPDYQGIDQSKLVPLLTAALKEAIGKIESLETKVAALEAAE